MCVATLKWVAFERMEWNPTTETLIDVLGISTAVKLLDRFGGRDLYVPREATADHPITCQIGPQPAERLCRAFGGRQIRLPVMASVLRRRRDDDIARRRAAGAKIVELADEFELTTSRIHQILRRLRMEDSSV